MKNYGKTIQWGDNSEYTINICTHWSCWGLPFIIDWHYFNDAIENRCYNLDIHFLCFILSIEIWRWKE